MNAKAFLVVALSLSLLSTPLSATMPDGWQTVEPAPTTEWLQAVTYGNGLFVAVGRPILTSPNGVDWTVPANSLAPSLAVAFGNNRFVAVGEGGMVRTSNDGSNWTTQQSAIFSSLVRGLAFGNGRFVGVGRSQQGTAYVFTSTNGIDWQYPPSPTANELNAVAYGSNLFVAVGSLGIILTSPDGRTWTARNSGTSRALYAVTFTGSRFVAGGEVGTVVTSTYGITWGPAAPASFEITALTSGGGAVVAVGHYEAAGRIHASADGLSWPGYAVEVPDVLYGVAYRPDYFVAVGVNGLILRSTGITPGGTNVWTKATSGDWQERHWSLGELPSSIHAAIVFTNSGWKALAINYDTTLNYSNSLNIQKLIIDAPADSSNLLLLNYAGLSTPLNIDRRLTIGPRGALLNYASALYVGRMDLDGRATFAENGQSVILGINAGVTAPAELTLSNGWLGSWEIHVAAGAPAVFNQFGGTNEGAALDVNDGGIYNLQGGTLHLTGGVKLTTGGRLVMTGGRMQMECCDLLEITGGELSIQNGSLKTLSLFMHSGNFQQAGGSIGLNEFGLHAFGADRAEARLSGGVLSAQTLIVGDSIAGHGTFLQSGGFLSATGSVGIAAASLYQLTGGFLNTEALGVSGRLEQSEGTNTITRLYVTAQGTYELNAGVLVAREITIDPGGALRRANGRIISRPDMNFNGGIFVPGSGTNEMGILNIANYSGVAARIDFGTAASSVLKFLDSHSLGPPEFPYNLVITNWAGSLRGGGAHQIYVGTDQNGFTVAQLAITKFANPAGLPAATYPARIVATGELVPDSGRPFLTYSRTSHGLTLSWDPSTQRLFTSTNVTGRYLIITPQPPTPYTVNFTEPKRFFVLLNITP